MADQKTTEEEMTCGRCGRLRAHGKGKRRRMVTLTDTSEMWLCDPCYTRKEIRGMVTSVRLQETNTWKRGK
jgi:hypothetical protein